jgi:hypothetical protein
MCRRDSKLVHRGQAGLFGPRSRQLFLALMFIVIGGRSRRTVAVFAREISRLLQIYCYLQWAALFLQANSARATREQ